MAARGRRIKRRGSGRSSCDGDEGLLQPQQAQQGQQQQQQAAAPGGGPSTATEPSTLSGNSVSEAPGADAGEEARMHQLLEAQKRNFEVGYLGSLPNNRCSGRRGAAPHARMHACLSWRPATVAKVWAPA